MRDSRDLSKIENVELIDTYVGYTYIYIYIYIYYNGIVNKI